MKPYNPGERGFTLIELLVVIGIVAILSVVVILTLNPAELLKQARDSNRISDLATIRSGLSLYLSDVSSPNLASSSNGNKYGNVFITGIATSALPTTPGWGVTAVFTSSTASTSLAVDSTGWIPVSFNGISSGAPLGVLPDDPVNNGNFFYEYVATSTGPAFKVAVHQMESQKYISVAANDGGLSASAYEV